jgi:hypothetical protein
LFWYPNFTEQLCERYVFRQCVHRPLDTPNDPSTLLGSTPTPPTPKSFFVYVAAKSYDLQGDKRERNSLERLE